MFYVEPGVTILDNVESNF